MRTDGWTHEANRRYSRQLLNAPPPKKKYYTIVSPLHSYLLILGVRRGIVPYEAHKFPVWERKNVELLLCGAHSVHCVCGLAASLENYVEKLRSSYMLPKNLHECYRQVLKIHFKVRNAEERNKSYITGGES